MKHLVTIIAVVEMVEAFAAEDVAGEDKKALALDVIVQTFARLGIQLNGRIIAGISEIIDTTVSLFNIFGWQTVLHNTLGGLLNEHEFKGSLERLKGGDND